VKQEDPIVIGVHPELTPPKAVGATVGELEMHGNLTVSNKFDSVREVGDKLAKMSYEQLTLLNQYMGGVSNFKVFFLNGSKIPEK
jgi:hypothetical protein